MNIWRSPVFHKNSKRIGRCHVNQRRRIANRENAAERIILGGRRAADGKRAPILLGCLEVVDPFGDRLDRIAVGIDRPHRALRREGVAGEIISRDPFVEERDALDDHPRPRHRTCDGRSADADGCDVVVGPRETKARFLAARKRRKRLARVNGSAVIVRVRICRPGGDEDVTLLRNSLRRSREIISTGNRRAVEPVAVKRGRSGLRRARTKIVRREHRRRDGIRCRRSAGRH